MCRTFVLVHVLIACISATSPTYPPVSKKDACDFWQKFTTEMNNIHRVYSYLSYSCTYDTNKCNGADCTGDIKYQVQGMNLIDIHFCFGMRVNHCDKISVDIYYSNKNTSFSDRIHHNDRKELSNLSMDTAFGTLTPFLFFNLTKPVPHHILFGIRVKVRVTTKIFDIEEWPSQYQQDIIPMTEIPVTSCPTIHTTPPPLLKNVTCVHRTLPTTPKTVPSGSNPTKDPFSKTTASPGMHSPPITTKIVPIHISSSTYNKECDMTSLGCGVNEMCVASDDHTNKGVCKCDNLHHLDRLTGLCSSSSTDGGTTFIWDLDTIHSTTIQTVVHSLPRTENKSSVSNTALIGGIVAGIVFLLVIVILGAIVCRRYRNNRQYIGRLMLDTDDDTDNVI